MYKKVIKYVDFNGNERQEECYFNLTKAEILQLQFGTAGGFAETVQRIVDEQDQASLMQIFSELVLKAYGKKSADGRQFIKNAQLREEFEQTGAYSEFFVQLATDANEAAAFIRGILPADMRDSIPENVAEMSTDEIKRLGQKA